MSNALSLMAAALVACLLLYLYPVSQSYEQQDQISYNIVYKSVTTFVDSVRSKGYISPAMYNDFMNELDKSGNLYEIEMQHDQKLYNPVYDNPSDASTFQNRYEVYYDSVYTEDILSVLYPENELPVSDSERKYLLKQYDSFSVTVTNSNTTKATLVRNLLNLSDSGNKVRIYLPYGGMVLNEDY